jgi:hypothetical protein
MKIRELLPKLLFALFFCVPFFTSFAQVKKTKAAKKAGKEGGQGCPEDRQDIIRTGKLLFQ